MRSTEHPEPPEIEAARSFLLAHPELAVQRIRAEGLSKYDVRLAALLGEIGSPIADPALPEAMRLLSDLNWPVYRAASETVFRFPRASIAAALQELVANGEFDVVDHFAWEVLQRRPAWVPAVRPVFEMAGEALQRGRSDGTAKESCDHLAGLLASLRQ